MKITSFKKNIALPLVSLTLMFQGCTQEDLKEVEALAPTVVQIEQLGKEVMDDFYGSCERDERLSLRTNELLEIYSQDFAPILIVRSCEPFRERAYRGNQLNSVLANYIKNLVRLASNETVTFTQDLEALGASVASSAEAFDATIGQEALNESVNLADSLLNIWSANFRREQLTGIIICTDDSVAQFTSLLSEAIQDTYIDGLLNDERESIYEQIQVEYNGIYRELQAGQINVDAFSSQNRELENRFNELYEDSVERQEKANSYQSILNSTMETHHSLAVLFKRGMTESEVRVLCDNYFSDGSIDGQEAKELPEVTAQQLSKAQEILDQHIKDISEIIEDIPN
jgi:hypothetical protein